MGLSISNRLELRVPSDSRWALDSNTSSCNTAATASTVLLSENYSSGNYDDDADSHHLLVLESYSLMCFYGQMFNSGNDGITASGTTGTDGF